MYQITAVKQQKNGKGMVEDYIFYKPVFPGMNENSLDFSEPASGFNNGYKRIPIQKPEVKELLSQLSAEIPEDFKFEADEAMSAIKHSNLPEMIVVLKVLWLDKQRAEGDLSYNKIETYDTILTQISREISVVLNIDAEKAQKKILDTLKRA